MPPVSDDTTTMQGPRYWRSLDELASTPEFRERLGKEFADYDPDQMLTSPTRRMFVKLMAASTALAGAGMSGCRRWPEQKVAPYVERPEGHTPGVPTPYATAMELGGVALPLLVSSYDGRPIKIEGNPSHPSSGGATTAMAQASVLGLYDPERSRTPRDHSISDPDRSTKAWSEAEAALRAAIDGLAGGTGGTGGTLAILSEATGSPTMAALRAKLPSWARWYEYESVSGDAEREGLKAAYGASLRAVLDLGEADVIVCLDADPLGLHPDSLRNAAGWAKGRRRVDETFTMSRMYCVEPGYTVTGTNADDRLAVKASRVAAIAKAIAAGVEAVSGEVALEADERKFVDAIVGDLAAAEGKAVVIVGPRQPASVHAAAAVINWKIGAVGKAVSYVAAEDRPTHLEAITGLTASLNAGEIKALLILGGNPAYDAPADLRFAEAIKKAAYSAHLSVYEDETSAACGWHLPASHWLEAWGDARSYDGTVSVVQPLIMPLYGPNTRSAIELVATVIGEPTTDGYELVRRTAGSFIAAAEFERGWRTALKNGYMEGTAIEAATANLTGGASAAVVAIEPSRSEGLELVFAADPSVYDGRFANNGWLQETPDPVSKLVWDNAAYVSPRTAKSHNPPLRHGDRLKLTVGDKSIDAAAFILPGEAAGSVRVMLGYGRTKAGYVGNGVGFDVHPLRSSGAMGYTAMKLTAGGGKRQLVTVQDHHAIDLNGIAQRQKRAIGHLIREATVEQYQKHRNFVEISAVHVPKGKDHLPLQIFEEPPYQPGHPDAGEHQWAMAIDLNACIGCNACMVACQAENNVPVVGKQECGRGREMHWIRVDRYFVSATKADGSLDHDEVIATVHQPLTCQQCENAPCEQVCPVAATVHDTEGLNVMIYNRCIGTRYCSNNCPYKVRRYNWFDWHFKPVHTGPSGGTFLGIPDQQQLDPNRVAPVRRLGFNPEVTVRMRGVMEKCSFCVQRIKAVTIPARNQGRKLADGDITPACAQTCPTQAIAFGDLNDPNSRVSKIFGERHKPKTGHPRAYEILKELNPRARNRYLGPVRNPKLAAPVRDYEAELKKATDWEAAHGVHGHGDGHGHDHEHKDEAPKAAH